MKISAFSYRVPGAVAALVLSLSVVACSTQGEGPATMEDAAAEVLPGQEGLPRAGESTKVGRGLYELVYHPGSDNVFAATAGGQGDDGGRIYALDAQTLEEVGSIAMPGYYAYGLGIHEGSGTLYTTDTRNGVVVVADVASMEVVAVVENPADEGGHLREIVVDEASGLVYVSSYDDPGMIWVIDNATHELVNTIQNVGNGTSGMVLDVPNGRLFAANMAAHDIAEIDLASGEVVRRFPAGGERPSNLDYDAGRQRLWSANQGTNDATVIDVTTGDLVTSVSVGDQALGIRYNPVNDLVYVTARRSGVVTAVDAESMNVVTWMQTGSYPNTIAVDRESGAAWVSNKARSAGRDAPPAFDPNGDTVTRLEQS